MTIDTADFFRLTSQARYEQFVSHIKEGGECFALADAEGCLTLTIANDQVLPVWPTAEMANQWATTEHQGFSALDIANEALLETWLPGMTQDKVSVGVAPNMAGEGIVVQAAELLQDIQG